MIEEAIIGSALVDDSSLSQIIDQVKPEYFENQKNRTIFKAISDVYKKNKSCDIILLTKHLKEINQLESLGGAYAISQLTNNSTYETKLEQYVYIVLESFLKRSLLKEVTYIQKILNEPISDVFDVISDLEKRVSNLTNQIVNKSYLRIDEVKDDVLMETSKAVNEGVKAGVMTGISKLNQQTNGWQKSDLIILAGRPGMGKTSAALDFGLTPAMNGKKVLLFSLEMSSEQLTKRALSILSGIDVQRVVNNTLNKDELNDLIGCSYNLDNIPLFLDDTPSITLSSLRNKARKAHKDKGLDLIIIDYLQLMRGESKGNREQEISEISRGLKALAKELNVPVIALSQLSRKCEERADKKPMLSDLRESGAIEQDADMVLFCHRPEYYQIPQYELGGNTLYTNGLFIFIIAKFRNGQTGEIKARWIGENTKITNYDEF